MYSKIPYAEIAHFSDPLNVSNINNNPEKLLWTQPTTDPVFTNIGPWEFKLVSTTAITRPNYGQCPQLPPPSPTTIRIQQQRAACDSQVVYRSVPAQAA